MPFDASGSREFSLHSLSAFQRCTARPDCQINGDWRRSAWLDVLFLLSVFLAALGSRSLTVYRFTPIYVTLIYDFLKGRFSPWYLVTAFIAVLGAVFIKFAGINEHFVLSFLVVQGANLCFAIGQVGYKYVMEQESTELPQHTVFGYFYLGALLVASVAFLLLGNPEKLPTTSVQWSILVYLGLIASGLGYFAWNKGACMVNAGALAIMNNALVPAGLVVNILIWNREVDLVRLSLGGAIILGSLWINETWVKRRVERDYQRQGLL